MKAIIIKNKLHLLENLKTIEIHAPGDDSYYLHFYYLGEQSRETSNPLTANEATAWLEKILKIIEQKA